MKKLQNLGKVLNKDEQKRIVGGVAEYHCTVYCNDYTDFQWTGPAYDCTDAESTSSNLCADYGGARGSDCNLS